MSDKLIQAIQAMTEQNIALRETLERKHDKLDATMDSVAVNLAQLSGQVNNNPRTSIGWHKALRRWAIAMSDKAQRAEIQIGPHTVEGFMLPDGSYVMSQTQAAEIVGLKVQNVSDFLRSKALKGLLGEGYTPQISEIEPESDQVRGGSRIRGLPLEVVSVYWVWQSSRGNKTALALTVAMVTETLERRFDNVFGVTRSEDERNQRLSDRFRSLERQLESISLELAAQDDARQEAARLRQRLKELGEDPYALPGEQG